MLNKFEELEKLAQIKEQWIISNDEFEEEKKKILNSNFIKNKITNSYYNNNYDWFFMKIFSHKWRVNRINYLIFILVYIIIFMFYEFIYIFNLEYYNEFIRIFLWLINIFIVISFFYLITVLMIKRLHDFNVNWWYLILIFFINMIFWIWNIALLFIPWTKWDNDFWPIPQS